MPASLFRGPPGYSTETRTLSKETGIACSTGWNSSLAAIRISSEKKEWAPISQIGTPFLLFTLADHGRDDVAYRLLLNDTYPSWGYMLSKEIGRATCRESVIH